MSGYCYEVRKMGVNIHPDFERVRERVQKGFHPISEGYAGDGI